MLRTVRMTLTMPTNADNHRLGPVALDQTKFPQRMRHRAENSTCTPGLSCMHVFYVIVYYWYMGNMGIMARGLQNT